MLEKLPEKIFSNSNKLLDWKEANQRNTQSALNSSACSLEDFSKRS